MLDDFIVWFTRPYHWRFNLGFVLGFLTAVAIGVFWFYVLPLIVRYIIY